LLLFLSHACSQLEALNEEANVFGLASSSSAAADTDDASDLPPLDQLDSESTEVIELTAFIDTAHRLSEPKWVKSGQLEDWISAIKTRETAGDAEENWRWRRKLEVADPEAVSLFLFLAREYAFSSLSCCAAGDACECTRNLGNEVKDRQSERATSFPQHPYEGFQRILEHSSASHSWRHLAPLSFTNPALSQST
jgi:hypothetical protein